MNQRPLPVTEDELHAYIDGELPTDRRGAVEAWLETHQDDANRVAAWRAQIETIRARGIAHPHGEVIFSGWQYKTLIDARWTVARDAS